MSAAARANSMTIESDGPESLKSTRTCAPFIQHYNTLNISLNTHIIEFQFRRQDDA